MQTLVSSNRKKKRLGGETQKRMTENNIKETVKDYEQALKNISPKWQYERY